MVLILSIEGDLSTSDVMEWINFFNMDCLRINDASSIAISRNLSNDYDLVLVNNQVLSRTNIQSCWRRKEKGHKILKIPIGENEHLNYQINSHIKSEFQEVRNGFYSVLKRVKTLGGYGDEINKLLSLETAVQVGLSIPSTLLTNSKKSVSEFLTKHKGVISKPISSGVFLGIGDVYWGMYTNKLTEEVVDKLPCIFSPSLIQEYIEKEYEIRTFYLDEKCYSMAIFSQSDLQTTVDFRKYNGKYPNRNVPYQLPEEIESKINLFMKTAGLNTGSLDLIKSKDGKYVFLEVNVFGQFGMVSAPCNYFLDKRIANWLVN